MNNILNISFSKLVVDKLPTFLRFQRVFAFLEASITPLETLLDDFKKSRADNIYKITMNGQVCHLRGLLNDNFDIELRRIKIVDGETSDWLTLWREDTFSENDNGQPIWVQKATSVTTDALGNKTYHNNNAVLIYKQGAVGSIGYDFVIKIPKELQGKIDEDRLKSLVNFYKLASKRYTPIYI